MRRISWTDHVTASGRTKTPVREARRGGSRRPRGADRGARGASRGPRRAARPSPGPPGRARPGAGGRSSCRARAAPGPRAPLARAPAHGRGDLGSTRGRSGLRRARRARSPSECAGAASRRRPSPRRSAPRGTRTRRTEGGAPTRSRSGPSSPLRARARDHGVGSREPPRTRRRCGHARPPRD